MVWILTNLKYRGSSTDSKEDIKDPSDLNMINDWTIMQKKTHKLRMVLDEINAQPELWSVTNQAKLLEF